MIAMLEYLQEKKSDVTKIFLKIACFWCGVEDPWMTIPPLNNTAMHVQIEYMITYYWAGLLILDHSYLFGNLTNSKIDETKALEPLKS
jgi:hypothetical protein